MMSYSDEDSRGMAALWRFVIHFSEYSIQPSVFEKLRLQLGNIARTATINHRRIFSLGLYVPYHRKLYLSEEKRSLKIAVFQKPSHVKD
jgi:hypothetical protein